MADGSETTDTRGRRTPRRRAVRVGLACVLAAKLALLAPVGVPALASGAAGKPVPPTGTAPAAAALDAAPASVVAAKTAPSFGVAKPDLHGLLVAVERRQAELDARERELAGREERLALYEKDVTAKVANLEEIEKRLSTRAKAASQAVDASAESLAKIYGGMKPEAAAPILDRLDDMTVLTIFRRMKEKQVGEILPLMNRDRAIALTQALAEQR
jgi:flagellar motility protein MotE (MotC chaperone)